MERYNGKKKTRQQADKKTSRSVQTGRMTEEERQRERRRRRRALQRKRERQRRLILGIMAIGILFVTAAAVRGIAGRLLSSSDSSDKKTAVNASDASISVKDSQTTEKASSEASAKDTLKAAKRKAAQYDYDGAMELLKKDASYSSNSDMQNAVSKYEEAKASCKSWPLEEVTHIFYHTLIRIRVRPLMETTKRLIIIRL